jgi:hypothetical protein
MKQLTNRTVAAAQIFSSALWALAHAPPIGDRRFAGHALIGWLLTLFISFGGGPLDGVLAILMFIASGAAFAWHAHERRKLERQGRRVHSLAGGTQRHKYDMVLVLVAGLACAVVLSKGLGVYLVLAALAVMITRKAAEMEWESYKRAMIDADIFQRGLMREVYGEDE